MRNMLRGRHWLVGCIVSASLLGACAPEEEVLAGDPQVAQAQPQELAAARDLRNVTATLSVEKASFSASESALVTITLHNEGRHAVKLLRWETAVDGLEEPLLQVMRDGEPVAYEGPHFKRAAARAEDFLVLTPGERLTSTVDLAEFYDLSKSGSYTLRYDVAPGDSRAHALTVSIEGRASGNAQAPGDVTTLGSVAFSKCDATQQSTILQAVSASSAMANDSATYLNGTPSGTPRYTTWFGAYSSSGWSTAKSHFTAIKDALDTKPLTFDCGCKKSYYAYVYPNQPYKVFLCRVFWSAPMTGTDSKGGTIIHELSHFTVVAGTDDWVYGQSGAKSLASSDPTKALNNADNHEYFAENTPFQQ
ncbi:MAG: peptidase M35 [Myxococcaceae bacterium]|nr:peptidase M35 [Myxococcaceae bacterium]